MDILKEFDKLYAKFEKEIKSEKAFNDDEKLLILTTMQMVMDEQKADVLQRN